MTRVPGSASPASAARPVGRTRTMWLVALGVAVVVQLLTLYSPQVPGTPPIAGFDKVVHLAVFAAPALAALLAGLSAPWVLGLLAVHAPVSELIQHFGLSRRSGDVFDMAADLCGVALGGLAYLVWIRRNA
jgi:hypothetical protein